MKSILSLVKPNEAVRVENMTLEQILTELLNYGRPRVGVYSSDCTWSCSVEMNTNTAGAQFTCKSEYNHPTPLSAARECLERTINAVSQYKK